MSPSELNDLRRRVLAKENVSPEELASALSAIRGLRTSAAASAASAKRSTKPRNEAESQAQLDDLLGNFGL